MITINTLKADNKNIYFGVTNTQNGIVSDSTVLYGGSQCAFNWWDYLSASDIPSGENTRNNYSDIAGTIQGFSSQYTGLSNLKIIISNGVNFAIGVAIEMKLTSNLHFAYIRPYLFDASNNLWHCGDYLNSDNASTKMGAWDSLPRVFPFVFYVLNSNTNKICISHSNYNGTQNIIGLFMTVSNSEQIGMSSTTTAPDPDPIVTPDTDPYGNAGDSSTGGGGGSWDNGSDPVGIPSLPSVGATNTGFITLFVPTQSQLKQVAEYLWGGLFDISTYLRLFEDPMDCILGLSVVPVSVPTSGSATITVGNIELSGISLPVASQQYVEVDCGSLTVNPYFGSYLDYEPYTKMSLFVPYSGVHTVNADDIMGRTVNLVYHIDILTGSLVAFLKCGDSVLYEFNGACGSNIPVNSMNYASTIENAIRIAVNIGTTVATAGASAPLTGADAGKRTAYQEFGRGVSLAGSTADGALSLKPNIDRAGSLGGTTGLLGNQTPYFIVTRPRLCKPKNQNKIKGYPAFINYSVSDLVGKGYTEFDTILLKNLYLTDDEKNELESILEGGVYL